MRKIAKFIRRCAGLAFKGDWRYYAWLACLAALAMVGLNAYSKQFVSGLVATGMSDQVSWGVYIANFTFVVGLAAAAVMLVVPVYIYKNEEIHDLVIFGELFAVSAILMCLMFVTVDLGRPDRFWHLIPGIGVFHFPGSMLSWDVLVLNGYLLLNIYICGYMLYCRYCNRKPSKWLYVPIVFIAIIWAVSIHTVTAFLYVGLGGRPFWNTAIIGPRFLASAFTAGPALIILALQVVRHVTSSVPDGGTGQPQWSAQDAGSRRRDATMKDLEVLARHLPELEAVPAVTRRGVLNGAMVLDVPAGGVVLHQGMTESSVFFVMQGRVVVRREEHGRLRIIRSVGPGEQFGENSALAGTPRVATAVAETRSLILQLPVESLRFLMKNQKMDEIIEWRMTERLMISDRGLLILRGIMQVAMLINLFLLANDAFKEFYTADRAGASSRYLFFGLHGNHALVPWIWTSIAFNITSMVLLVLPASRRLGWLDVACVLAVVGIWIEKGMGMVVPGFIPSPLGEMVEYTPTLNETLVCVGIWAFGFLSFTLLLRMAVPILQGTLSRSSET